MLALTSAKNTVTVSIIADVLCAPLGRNDRPPRTVKRIPLGGSKSDLTDDFEQQPPSVARVATHPWAYLISLELARPFARRQASCSAGKFGLAYAKMKNS